VAQEAAGDDITDRLDSLAGCACHEDASIHGSPLALYFRSL
jgi:hypothetical protein